MPPRVQKKKNVPIVEYHVVNDVTIAPFIGSAAQLQPEVLLDERQDPAPTISQPHPPPQPTIQYIRLRAPKLPLTRPKLSTCCLWCCHPHETLGVGLPIKFKNGVYSTIGQFCSLECAASFNFNSSEISHNVWESFHLLNGMARDAGVPTPIKQAPSRLSLAMFGGDMDIQEFRSQMKTTTVLPIPMVPVCQIMEEIHVLSPDKHDCVPLDNTRVQLAKSNNRGQKKDTINEKMRMRQEQSDARLPETIS